MGIIMKKGVTITVGVDNAAIVGSDNYALQAAVDYVSGLGGGTVSIGAGVYEMEDSLHLRSNVTVIGAGEDTVLCKGNGHTLPVGYGRRLRRRTDYSCRWIRV